MIRSKNQSEIEYLRAKVQELETKLAVATRRSSKKNLEIGKRYYAIDRYGLPTQVVYRETYSSSPRIRNMVEIGNLFEEPEEANMVVEKLKALNRLKDCGLYFQSIETDQENFTIQGGIVASENIDAETEDLRILFETGKI